MSKNIIFILENHSFFVSSRLGKDTIEENKFFDTISYIGLPLLRMCRTLSEEKVNFKFAFTMSPVVCAMLNDEIFMERYKLSLEKKISFAEKEAERLKKEPAKLKTLEKFAGCLRRNLEDFEKYNRNLIGEVNKLALKGNIEVLGTTGESCFLPMYKNMPEAIDAQIEMGQIVHQKYFSCVPYGFWLPALGYYEGVEAALEKYGYEYSILNAKSFLLSEKVPKYGVFAPAEVESGFRFLALDLNAYDQLYFSEKALSKNPCYLDTEDDIAFSLDQEYLAPLFDTSKGRRSTGFRYNNKKSPGSNAYDCTEAALQIKKDAEIFVNTRLKALTKAEKLMGKNSPSSVCVLPSQLLGMQWYEGISWLEEVFRIIDKRDDLNAELPGKIVKETVQIHTVHPFFSSLLDSGYAGELLTKENNWIYRHVLKSTERLIKTVDSFKDTPCSPIKGRIMNCAAKEVMLMQSFYWPLMCGNIYYKEYAERAFKEHLAAFIHTYEILSADKEELKWICSREKEVPVLQEINYNFYRKKT